MRKEYKHYTAEEKVAILRRHLLDEFLRLTDDEVSGVESIVREAFEGFPSGP